MGFRFRKSISLGGGFRVNLSKSGVGYSWGVKGARITRTAKGRTRVTASIPGTGLSYSEEIGGREQKNAVRMSENARYREKEERKQMYWGKFVICLLFGWLGVHKFMEKKIGMGFLYLFTLGLFGVGWLVDIIRYFCAAIRHGKLFGKITAGILGALVILGLAAGVGGSDETPKDQNMEQMTAAPTVAIEVTATPDATAMPEATAAIAQTVVPTATTEPTATTRPTAAPTEDVGGFVLKRGDKSEDVRNLQLMLIGLGYLNGNADGDFGPKTEQAVLAYQKAAGLIESGVCDDATYRHMQSDEAVPAPTKKATTKPTQKPTKRPSDDSKDETVSNAPYIASKNSKVFHKASCGSVDTIKEANKRFYNSREEAVASGRRPCANCNP